MLGIYKCAALGVFRMSSTLPQRQFNCGVIINLISHRNREAMMMATMDGVGDASDQVRNLSLQ